MDVLHGDSHANVSNLISFSQPRFSPTSSWPSTSSQVIHFFPQGRSFLAFISGNFHHFSVFPNFPNFQIFPIFHGFHNFLFTTFLPFPIVKPVRFHHFHHGWIHFFTNPPSWPTVDPWCWSPGCAMNWVPRRWGWGWRWWRWELFQPMTSLELVMIRYSQW